MAVGGSTPLVTPVFGIVQTSERMAEANLLSDFVALVQRMSPQRLVTIVAPTQPEEERLSFDAIFEGLPLGRILAFQFKRPVQRVRPPRICYSMSVWQQLKLVGSFATHEAFYALVPYSSVASFVANRQFLLDESAAVDVHDIPRRGKAAQSTRTIYYEYALLQTGRKSFRIKVTDPRLRRTPPKP